MRSNKRRHRWRSDSEILASDTDLALLRAVHAGRVVRGPHGGQTSMFEPHMLDGESIRFQLQWLANADLILMPISGPPVIAPRGRRLLEVANGEAAPRPEDPR